MLKTICFGSFFTVIFVSFPSLTLAELFQNTHFASPSQAEIEAVNDAIMADEELGPKIQLWEKSTTPSILQNGIDAVKQRAQASPKGSPLRWVFVIYTKDFSRKRGDSTTYLWALSEMTDWEIPEPEKSPAADAVKYFETEKPRFSKSSAAESLPSVLRLMDFAVRSGDSSATLGLYSPVEELNGRARRNPEVTQKAAGYLEKALGLTIEDEAFETGQGIAEALQKFYLPADRETSKKLEEVATKMVRLVKLSKQIKSGSTPLAATEKKVVLDQVKELLKALQPEGTLLFAASSSLVYCNSTDVKYLKIDEGTVDITCLQKEARACGVWDESVTPNGPFKVTGTVRNNHDTRLTFGYDPKKPNNKIFVRLGPDPSFGEIHYFTRDDRNKNHDVIISKPRQKIRLKPLGKGFYEFRFELICNGPNITLSVNGVEVTRGNLLQVPTKQGIDIPRTVPAGLVGVHTALYSKPPYNIVVSDLRVIESP